MMKAILNNLNNYLPMKEFLNFFFITALGDYLQTEVNIVTLEKEISQKAVISLTGLKLNTSVINERHLSSSPMKLIEGNINKLEMTLSDDKLSIHLSEMTLLVMPVFNTNKLIIMQSGHFKQKHHIEKPSTTNQTLVESMINSIMQNVDITIDSICVKILTYEVFDNTLDNPTLSIFISKLCCKNQGGLKEGDFFLFNKVISLDNFCVKIDKYYTQDESIFYNACKIQDEKLLFNFFCSNNTLCAIDYNKAPAILIGIKRLDSSNIKNNDKDKDKESPTEKNNSLTIIKEQVKIDIDIQRIEVIINSTQIAQLYMFNTICNNIYSKTKSSYSTSSTGIVANSPVNKPELKIFGHIISDSLINISFELINILINENITAKETPKLFSFYSNELQKTIKSIDEIENHFCYFEDNFLLLTIDTIKYSAFDSSSISQSSFEIKQIAVDYVEYHSKQPKKTSTLMSKKYSFMKMGTGSKLALNQMQSGGESIYQSAQSGMNSSCYESVLDSELVLIENFNKLIAYDFFNSSLRILFIDKIESKSYSNRTSTQNQSVTNCSLSSISLDFHFIFLFKIMKFIYANGQLVKEISKGGTNQTKEKEVIVNFEDNYIDNNLNKKTNDYDRKSKANSSGSIIKEKNQIFISIKSFSAKLFNFKRDLNSIDTNWFYYEFFKSNIQDHYMNKGSPSLYQMPQNIPIDSIKSKDYLLFKMTEIKVLFASKHKESEIKIIFTHIILNYNYYTLLSFANSELPSIVIKGKKNEFITGLAVPTKLSTLEPSQEFIVQDIDMNALKNKNEMSIRNQFITIKSQYDYKDHSSTLRISFNLYEDIQVNCEYSLIKQLIMYSDTLMFSANIAQIYENYCRSVNKSLIKKVFKLYQIPTIEEQSPITQSKTNLFITMEISNLTLFLNRNNTIDKEGNLIKLVFDKLTSNVAFKYDRPINEAEIDINNIQLFIKKNTKSKGDLRQSHTSLIKKRNTVSQEEDANEYILFLSKTGEVSSSASLKPSMIALHVYFNNNINKKDNSNLHIEKQEMTDDNCYQMFLLQNQLPMPDMDISTKLIINDCYINPIWYNFDLKSNGLSFFIEEMNSFNEDDYLNNDDQNVKELIPLCQERKIDLELTIEIQMIYIDLFFAASSIPKKDWMRMILMLSNAKLKQKEQYSEIILNQCRFFYLHDFDYSGVDKLIASTDLILNLIEDIPKEASYLNRIGFTELCYIENLQLTKRNNGISEQLQKINIILNINAIELFFCKDSFILIQNFFNKINEFYQNIKLHFTKDKLIIDDIEGENEEENNDELNIKSIVNKKEVTSNSVDVTTALRKEYLVIENYCFNPNKFDQQLDEIKEIDAEEDYDKLNVMKKVRPKKRKSFDVLFLNDNIDLEEINEGDVQITGSINTIRLYLFKGRDYSFLSSSSKSEKNTIQEEYYTNPIEQGNKSMFSNQSIIIEDNYMNRDILSKNPLVFLYQSRPRKKQRDYFNHICFYLSNMKGEVSYFNTSDIMLSSSITISKITIEDKIKLSKFTKILSKYNYEDNLLNFCSVKLDIIRSPKDQSSEDVQLVIEAQISPINILVDQISLIFLLQFFQIKLDLLNTNLFIDNSTLDFKANKTIVTKSPNSNNSTFGLNESYLSDIGIFERIENKLSQNKDMKEVKSDDNSGGFISIKKISIKEFKLNFSYNSHELSIQQLKRKNYLELLNISNITDFQVQFKGYDSKEMKSINDSLIDLISFWKNDIAKNQIVSAVLHSVAVIRPFVAIFDSVFDLIRQPWSSYRKEHNLKKGISKGIKGFFSTFTTQSLFIGEKSFKTIQKMLGARRSNILNKNSYYKKWMYKVNDGKRKYDEHFLK